MGVGHCWSPWSVRRAGRDETGGDGWGRRRRRAPLADGHGAQGRGEPAGRVRERLQHRNPLSCARRSGDVCTKGNVGPSSDLSSLVVSSPPVSPAMVAYARGIAEPRLSPDGREVAYVTTVNRRAALAVVPAGGGPEEVLTSDLVPRGQGGYGGGAFAWVPDGRALVVAAAGDLWLVSRARRAGPAAHRARRRGTGGRTRGGARRELGSPTPATCATSPSCPWPTMVRMAGAAVGRRRLRRRPRLVVRRRTRPVADVGRPGDALGREPDRVAGERRQRPHRAGARRSGQPIVAGTTITG